MNATLPSPTLYSPSTRDSFFTSYAAAISGALSGLEVTDRGHNLIDCDDAVRAVCKQSGELHKQRRKQFLCGNGASAALANHMALDWTKNGGLPTMSFSDSAFLTAVSNDLGNDEVFCAPLRWYGAAGDRLMAISSSGNSPNIVRAIGAARDIGMSIVTFTGLKPDNKSRQLGDLNFYVPAKTYGIVECAHQILLHLCLDCFMGIKEWEKTREQNMLKSEFCL